LNIDFTLFSAPLSLCLSNSIIINLFRNMASSLLLFSNRISFLSEDCYVSDTRKPMSDDTCSMLRLGCYLGPAENFSGPNQNEGYRLLCEAR
jgi:hypothetical protein